MTLKVAAARLIKAEGQRDAANGPDPRERAMAAMARAQDDIESAETEISRLRAGDDPSYRRWRQHTQARRFSRPTLELLYEAELVIE